MDPPANPHRNSPPSMPLTLQISLARPPEPHTYEELIREQGRFEFPSSSNSEVQAGNEPQRCDGENQRRKKDVHATPFPDPHEKQNSISHNTMSLPFPAYADPSTKTIDLPVLSILADKEDLLKANTTSAAASKAFHTPVSYSVDASPNAPAKAGGGDSTVDLKGNRRTRCREDEGPYFGSHSNMNLESMRSSPGTAGGYEEIAGNETPFWGGSRDESDGGDINQGAGLKMEYRNNVCQHRSWFSSSSNNTHPAPWSVPERANQESTSTRGDKWDFRTPAQKVEAHGGDSTQRWGNCGGNNNGGGWNHTNNNHRDDWGILGANADDGKVVEDNHKRRQGHVRSRHSSLVQNFEPRPVSPDPSRRLSESTVRPLPQHRQQLPHITPVAGLHTHHHHHHTYAYGTPDKPSLPQQNEREYIRELRERNTAQAELLNDQRIRIAVLENSVKHLKKSEADAVNASIFIAQKLGSSLAAQGSTLHRVIQKSGSPHRVNKAEKLKRDVERLKKKYSVLASLVNDLTNHFEGRSCSSENGDEDISSSSIKAKRKGKERMFDSSKKVSNAKYEGFTAITKEGACSGEVRAACEKGEDSTKLQKVAGDCFERLPCPVHKYSKSENGTQGVSGWSESFSSDITTVSNSPNSNITSSSSGSDAIRQLAHKMQPVNRMSDVGLQSLDDCLRGDMDDCPPDPMTSKVTVEPLSTQIESRMKGILPLPNLPPPSVLKTGFDLTNARRGAEYDHPARQPEFHRGGINNNNRFGAISSLSPYADTTPYKLWESPEERKAAIEVHQSQIRRDGIRYPDMFRYGIQYVPEDEDENYFRTVCISNLPSDTDLRDVLARVRGGSVADAVLMDTRRLMGGTMSAKVVFVEDYDAKGFVDYAAAHPIAFGEDNDTIKAVVTLIATPTYPRSQGRVKRMKQKHRDTRCLAIKDFPRDLSLAKIQLDIACGNLHRSDNLIEFYLDEQNTLHLEFSSIPLAGSTFAILTHFFLYRGLEVNYEPDPCSGPLEELAMPVLPRPRMLPHTRLSSSPYNPYSSSDKQTSHSTTVSQDIMQTQHKPQTALNDQKVKIPTFSGAGITSSSWADEVIEEAESANTMDPVSATQSYPSNLDTEHEEHCELPNTHCEVPPNSPVAGVLPMKTTSGVVFKEVLNVLLTDNVTMLIKETHTAFKKAPIGLAGTGTIVLRTEDIDSSLKGQKNMMFFAEDNARKGGDSPKLLQAGATGPMIETGSEKGQRKGVDNTTTLQSHTERKLGKLPSAELSRDHEDLPQRSSSQLASTSGHPAILIKKIAEEDPFRDSTHLGCKEEVSPTLEYVLNKPKPRPTAPVQKDDFQNETKAIPSSLLTTPITRLEAAAESALLHNPATTRQELSAVPEEQTPSEPSPTPKYITQGLQVRDHVQTPQKSHIHDQRPKTHKHAGVGVNRVILGDYYPGMDFASFTPSKWTPGDIESLQSTGLRKDGRGTDRIRGNGVQDSEVISDVKIGSPKFQVGTLMQKGDLGEGAWIKEQNMAKNPDEVDLDDEDEIEKVEIEPEKEK